MSLFRTYIIGCLTGIAGLAAPAAPAAVTFNKEVLPILQKNCQACHRPGEVAPFSLLSYKDARPWAKAMKAAVVSQKMPPWFADPKVGHWKNDPRLSEADVKTLSAWADNGAVEGNPKDAPAPLKFEDGWNIKPDMVIEMPKDFNVPATGTVNYQNFLVKTNFPEDMWVVATEMRPGNRAVVHHMRGTVVPPGSSFMAKAVLGDPYEDGNPDIGKLKVEEGGGDLLGKYNPGVRAQYFDEINSAKFVPKGASIVFNIHYTAIGKAATDRSRLGLVFAKKAPANRYYLSVGPIAFNLAIPAATADAEVAAEQITTEDMQLVYLQPHMHLRGKDYEIRLIYPTGETQTIFKAKWDFNWQDGFDLEKPLLIPKGTRIQGLAHFDNSTNNPFNPDPAQRIVWGPQNWDEMQSCYMGVIMDRSIDPAKAFKATGVSRLPVPQAGPTFAQLAPPDAK